MFILKDISMGDFILKVVDWKHWDTNGVPNWGASLSNLDKSDKGY